MRQDNIKNNLDDLNIYALIPARLGSKRLKKKNIFPFLGRPMIEYGIDACLRSQLIKRVIVSTESEEIAVVAKQAGAEVLQRPSELAEDHIITQDVVKHFANSFPEVDIVVLVQANSPTVKTENIEKAIRLLVNNNLREVRSVDRAGLENGSFWVTTREAVFWDGLSVYFGVVQDDSVDIHTIDDVKKAEEQAFQERNKKESSSL